MRKFMIGLAGAAIAIAAPPAFAHPDPYDDEYERAPTVQELAKEAVVKLIAQAKLPASWSNSRVVGTTTRMRSGAEQLVVTFQNDLIRDRTKRTLYVILTRGGTFISANHRLT